MGIRKHNKAEAEKQARKSQYVARLNDCPTSPRKMRLIADLIRGERVEKALGVLKYSPQGSKYNHVQTATLSHVELAGEE